MVEIDAAAPARRYILRGDDAAARLAGAAFGIALPARPLRAAEAGPRAALWLGPDEWLLLSPDGDDPGAALAQALEGQPHSLVDISDGQAGLIVRGPGAARALSAGCPLDLHPAAFPPGMAARTVLGRTGITLWRRGPEVWRLELGRSFGAYARDFLAEAARGMPAF